MLREFLESLLVKTQSPLVRKLGYGRETVALEARHRRLRLQWMPHIEATRTALLQAAQAAKDTNGIAMIIGGGVICDLPLTELLSCFRQIWLVDVAFSWQTLWQIRRYCGRVRWVMADVTGVIVRHNQNIYMPDDFYAPQAFDFQLPGKLCWMASVNCMTQLPLPIVEYLLQQAMDEASAERLARELIIAHLKQISGVNVPVCLISEVADQLFDVHGDLLELSEYRGLILPALQEGGYRLLTAWDWLVNPPGELGHERWERRRVEAWIANS